VSGDPQSPRGRRLFAVSLVLSAIGVGLVAWWVLMDARSWVVLCGGAVAAFAGVVVGAKARRATPEVDEQRGGR
jgi:hypothetical protein